MKIPAILVTSLLVCGFANGRVIDSSAAASAEASASSSTSRHIGLLHGKRHYLKEGKKTDGNVVTSLNAPALKVGIKNGGLDVTKGAAILEAAISDATTHTDQRSLLDLGLGVIANSAEVTAKAQAAASAQAGATADDLIMKTLAILEKTDQTENYAAIRVKKAAKAAEAAMIAAARASAAAAAAKITSQQSAAAAGNAAVSEAKANAESIIGNKANAVMAETAAVFAATAAEATQAAINAKKLAQAAAKAQAEVTEASSEVVIALANARAAVQRANADQNACTTQTQAASQIQSRASASESAASAQSETNTAAAKAVAVTDAEVAKQAKLYVKKLKRDMWLHFNMKGEVKTEGAAVAIGKGHYGMKRAGGSSEASAAASSNVSMGGRHGYKNRVSGAQAAASAGSSGKVL